MRVATSPRRSAATLIEETPIRFEAEARRVWAPANSLFASAPSLTCTPKGNGTFKILVRAEPTNNYGVGLVRMRCETPSYFSGAPTDQHSFWLHHSAPVPAVIRFAGRRIELKTPLRSLSVYPAAADKITESYAPGEGTLVRVSAECLALAASQLVPHDSTLVEKMDGYDDALFRMGETLEAEAAAGHPNGMLFWSSATDVFIRHLCTHHLSSTAKPSRGAVSRDALRRLDTYIHENLGESLDLDSLAAVIGCERFHFAHRFRATVGMGPHRYVMRLRLHHAMERIRTGSGSLTEIAAEAGFTDHSHLCRWIRRVYNLRPKDLRR